MLSEQSSRATVGRLTNDQQSVIGAIKRGRNVVITGPGGTGKTTIINYLKDVMDPDRYLGITAMTGAAAVLIGGTTLHSYLGIGLGKDSEDDLVKKINRREKLKNKWRDTNILVVDEVSMLPADLFDKLNMIAKRVRKRSEPFGGMQLVFGGDFLQLPCIKGDFCFESKAWRECKFEIFHLTKIMRQEDRQFQECLNRARFGEMTDDDFEYITQSVPTKEKIASMEIKPTRILCENVDVNEINDAKLKQLPVEDVHQYKYKRLLTSFTLDNATYACPYSNTPLRLMMAELSVIPWLLCTVTAYAKSGI